MRLKLLNRHPSSGTNFQTLRNYSHLACTKCGGWECWRGGVVDSRGHYLPRRVLFYSIFMLIGILAAAGLLSPRAVFANDIPRTNPDLNKWKEKEVTQNGRIFKAIITN